MSLRGAWTYTLGSGETLAEQGIGGVGALLEASTRPTRPRADRGRATPLTRTNLRRVGSVPAGAAMRRGARLRLAGARGALHGGRTTAWPHFPKGRTRGILPEHAALSHEVEWSVPTPLPSIRCPDWFIHCTLRGLGRVVKDAISPHSRIPNPPPPRLRLASTGRGLKEIGEIVRQTTQNRARAEQRIHDKWTEVIRGVRIVEDTLTGERRDVDLAYSKEIVRRLNQAEGADRYREIPLWQLNQ